MKILDKFLITSFVPPFIVSFGIALFVLVMQVLWVYIDEIMGKGLTIFELTELITYLSMTLVPMAFPIAVLISTVMVMGNLAEQYELSSLKSAGVGLVRILRPLMFVVGAITVLSVFVSEMVIPWANLKFYSRFYDIRKSKPTLTLQEGVFNDEFQDYTLRIGKKGRDEKSLENIMLFSNRTSGNLVNQTTAKKGEMYTTADKQYIVMNLFDGMQFQETQAASNTGNKRYPFIRIKFQSWQKIFDLTEFERRSTDEDLFKNHQKMKNSWQLQHSADSIVHTGKNYINDMRRSVGDQFTIKDGVSKLDSIVKKSVDTLQKSVESGVKTPIIAKSTKPLKVSKEQNAKGAAALDSFSNSRLDDTPFAKKSNRQAVIAQKDTQTAKKLPDYFYDFTKTKSVVDLSAIYVIAEAKSKTAQSAAESVIRQIGDLKTSAGKYIYEMHMKYNYAIICFVFLFIGAPMGAIIQKGGFGMPILVAIGFFMVYMVSNIYCKNLKATGDLNAEMAAWLPVLAMIPIAVIVTYRALNDYKFINFDLGKIVQKLNPKLLFDLLKKPKPSIKI